MAQIKSLVLSLKNKGGYMRKNGKQNDKNQLELDFQKIQRQNSENKVSQPYPERAEKHRTIKPDCDNAHLSKTTGRDKVKTEALEEQEEETSSSESSEKVQLFDNRIDVITTEELAVIFGLAPQTIRNWTAQGKLPYVKIGRRNLFLMRSIKRWLNQKEGSLWE